MGITILRPLLSIDSFVENFVDALRPEGEMLITC